MIHARMNHSRLWRYPPLRMSSDETPDAPERTSRSWTRVYPSQTFIGISKFVLAHTVLLFLCVKGWFIFHRRDSFTGPHSLPKASKNFQKFYDFGPDEGASNMHPSCVLRTHTVACNAQHRVSPVVSLSPTHNPRRLPLTL